MIKIKNRDSISVNMPSRKLNVKYHQLERALNEQLSGLQIINFLEKYSS